MARLALVTGTGAVLAVAVAVAASPLTPIGAARLAEPDPGVHADIAVLAAGLAIIALLPLIAACPAGLARGAIRAAGPPGVAGRQPAGAAVPLMTALTAAGPVTTGLGMRMAFEPGRGRTAVPVRSALAGTTIAITALVAAAVFGTSLVGLVSTPARYGANWDAELEYRLRRRLRTLGRAAAVCGHRDRRVRGGQHRPGHGRRLAGPVDRRRPGARRRLPDPARRPCAGRAGEIALGEQTLRALGAHLGQTVSGRGRQSRQDRRERERRGRCASSGRLSSPTSACPNSATPTWATAPWSRTHAAVREHARNGLRPRHADLLQLLRCSGTGRGPTRQPPPSRLLAATTKAGCPLSSCTMTTDQRPGDIRDYAFGA